MRPLAGAAQEVPTPEAAIAAKADVWGEAALRQPGGPSYEFFEKLLPPPRYVNSDFRHYPIVLTAPGSPAKARIISNGTGINTRGGTRSWYDVGTAVTFRVGPDELRFGDYFERVEGPRFAQGYLPIVEISYRHGEAVYRQETFASVEPGLMSNAVVFARFSLAEGAQGNVALQIDGDDPVKAGKGVLLDEAGRALVWFDANWKWVPARKRLVAALKDKKMATLAIASKPFAEAIPSPVAAGGFVKQQKRCVEVWETLLRRGMRVEVPEPVVNHAWRALVIANFGLLNGDRIHYSAGNQYNQLYEAEGSDTARAMMLWGYTNDTRRMIVPLLDFTRKGLEYHQAGHKLQTLAHYYWVTRDAAFLREMQPRWEKELARVVNGRTNEHGLFPREQYCGDVATPVYSMNSNAKAWRAMKDFAQVLEALGDREQARQLTQTAAEFRTKIIAAMAKSERRDVQPPFLPIALFGEEEPCIPITGTKIGSYWNLMANYVLGTEVFGVDTERERWLVDFMRQQGGFCMGMTRSRPAPTFWTGLDSINPLYGLRSTLTTLRRDEPDLALVSFYGMLAQGFTRDTFITGEGCSLRPLDEHGRLFYCPPNSAGNAYFLWMLRGLLVQDWDLNEDGRPDTLRLLFATPRRWLEGGKTINVARAPTEFGEVSVRVESRLAKGEVIAEVEPPKHSPDKMLLRLRLPEGWRIKSATTGGQLLRADEQGTVDVSGMREAFTLRCVVERVR
ncbi:MAG: hypothetical protein AB1705_06460 [Verrucomicrobiota bacterium]